MLLTSFSLRRFIIRLFYKAEPATEFIIARGRTGMYLKKGPWPILRYSPRPVFGLFQNAVHQSKPIHSHPIRTKRCRREASFHTHRRNEQHSRQEVNRLQHLPNDPRNALLDLLTQRRVMKPWAWLILPRKRSSYQHFPNHSNEAHRK